MIDEGDIKCEVLNYIYKLIYNEEKTHNDALVSLSRLAQTMKNCQVIKIINLSRAFFRYILLRESVNYVTLLNKVQDFVI